MKYHLLPFCISDVGIEEFRKSEALIVGDSMFSVKRDGPYFTLFPFMLNGPGSPEG